MTSFAHLRQYIHKQFTVLKPTIETYHRLQQDVGLNLIEVTEVVVFLELLHGITLPDEVLTPNLTAGQLCALVEQRAQAINPRHSVNAVDGTPRQLKRLVDTVRVSKLA